MRAHQREREGRRLEKSADAFSTSVPHVDCSQVFQLLVQKNEVVKLSPLQTTKVLINEFRCYEAKTFLYFRLTTSKFIYFQCEARCSEQLKYF